MSTRCTTLGLILWYLGIIPADPEPPHDIVEAHAWRETLVRQKLDTLNLTECVFSAAAAPGELYAEPDVLVLAVPAAAVVLGAGGQEEAAGGGPDDDGMKQHSPKNLAGSQCGRNLNSLTADPCLVSQLHDGWCKKI